MVSSCVILLQSSSSPIIKIINTAASEQSEAFLFVKMFITASLIKLNVDNVFADQFFVQKFFSLSCLPVGIIRRGNA